MTINKASTFFKKEPAFLKQNYQGVIIFLDSTKGGDKFHWVVVKGQLLTNLIDFFSL